MNETIKIILILLLIIFIFVLFSYDYNLKKFISKVKLNDYVKLSKFDIFNLYTFLESKYENIILPKKIIFTEDNDKDNNKSFICNLKFVSNNKKENIKIKFKPNENNLFITKYMFFDRYGIFQIIDDELHNSDVPEINHLSSDESDNLNFDVNDIINSDTETLKNISNKEIFLKKSEDIVNNDTENDTTESIINRIL